MADSYAYRVRTREGKVIAGSMEADGESAVANRLRSQGLVPVQIRKESKVNTKTEFRIRAEKVKIKDLAIFSRQFATMINSGLSLLRTLNILSEQTENGTLAKTIGLLRDDVERGSSLSASMSKHPKVFSNLFVSMIRAGETGGQLDTVLLRVADNYEADHRLRQKVKSAMTYPIVVAGIAVLLVTIMLLFVVPTFAEMFVGLGGELPLPTKVLLMLSKSAKFLVPLAFVGSIVAAVVYRKLRLSNRDFRLAADKTKLRIPIFGELFQKVAVSRFTRTLALLLRAGVPVLQALDIVGDSTGNEVLARAANDVKESVRSGETVASPLQQHKVFPPMVVQMISVGEDTGALDAMLDKISDFYDQEVESTTEALTSLIEPIMIAVLGGIVGAMVIALYMPMFKIFDLIK
ncbi:MAG: type pilus assembly protein PilC [Actinomycetota bacterium]|jgi:type IV pilus assembly protein PilC|nr:type pilus assembly protein PilC [Actinomycetota bacterium]